MQIFIRAAFGISEIPEVRGEALEAEEEGFLESFPWSKRVTGYIYCGLLLLVPILGSYCECPQFPWVETFATGKCPS